MEIPSALTADLRTLTEALDPPRIDLVDQLHRVMADIRMTHASYLGLALTIVLDGMPFTIVAFENPADDDIRSSAHVPLPTLCDVEAGSAIVFYASSPIAFGELADDISVAFGLARDAIHLDGHLLPPEATEAGTVDGTARPVNQALGVLIERGFAPVAAQAELHRLAERTGGDLAGAAAQVIRGATDGPPGVP